MIGTKKAVTTDILVKMIQDAENNDYNRLPVENLADDLDPNGIHILEALMIHEHAQGVSVAPHVRCQVFAKMKDSMQPAIFTMDTNMKMFTDAVEAKELSALLQTAARIITG